MTSAVPSVPDPQLLAASYQAVRAFTMQLAAPLSAEDCMVQSMPDVSPTKWHLAHTSWFFEHFLLREFLSGYRVFDERFGYLFNSYYYQVGQMHRRPERGFLSRPALAEVMAYREHVDEHMQRLLSEADAEVRRRTVLGLNHEQQHQELILTDIKHVFSCNPLKPAYREREDTVAGSSPPLRFIEVPAGVQRIGHEGEGFAYDNESPVHEVMIQPAVIANRLVTNGEYREFIRDGGYRRPEFWLSQGWSTVQEQGWQRPLYWNEDLSAEFTLAGMREIRDDAPVCHVSYFEADAFARWADARLPREAEWEAWARGCELGGNFADSGALHPQPASGDGKLQVFGDAWEWTMSAYSAYPGYRPDDGALGEYNGKFMCGQYVLRGGSCATHSTHIRPTYRNFFYPADRWQFSGIRLARDAA